MLFQQQGYFPDRPAPDIRHRYFPRRYWRRRNRLRRRRPWSWRFRWLHRFGRLKRRWWLRRTDSQNPDYLRHCVRKHRRGDFPSVI